MAKTVVQMTKFKLRRVTDARFTVQ